MDKNLSNSVVIYYVTIFLSLFIASCSQKLASTPTDFPTILDTITETVVPTHTKHPTSTYTPSLTSAPSPTSSPSRTPSPEPLEVVKVMQYNVLWGGRHTGRCAKKSGAYGDTFDLVLSIIRQTDPDILIVNEACDWEKLAPQIMSSLGMSNYFVGIDYIDGLAPVALFTKLEIIETESLKFSDIITMENIFRGIRVKVKTPNDNVLDIFGVHITPLAGDEGVTAQKNQGKWLSSLMEPYKENNLILVGDLNATYEFYYPIFDPMGLTGLMNGGVHYRWTGESWLPIDQIWISSNLRFEPWSEHKEYYENLKSTVPLWETASDHNPESAVIGIYPP